MNPKDYKMTAITLPETTKVTFHKVLSVEGPVLFYSGQFQHIFVLIFLLLINRHFEEKFVSFCTTMTVHLNLSRMPSSSKFFDLPELACAII